MKLQHLGTLRDFFDSADIPEKIIKPDKIPGFLDDIFVVSYRHDSETKEYLLGLAYEKDFSFDIPGIPDIKLIAAYAEAAGYSQLLFRVNYGENPFVKAEDIPFLLRFSDRFLTPVDPAEVYSQIDCQGSIRVDKDLKIDITGLNQFSLNRSLIGKTGLIFTAENVLIQLSEPITAGDFQGVSIARAIIELPENWEDLTERPDPGEATVETEAAEEVDIETELLEENFNVELPDEEILDADGEDTVEVVDTPYAHVVATEVSFEADKGFSGQLALDTTDSDHLKTKLPLELELQLNRFDITFIDDRVSSSNIKGTLFIPQLVDAGDDGASTTEKKLAPLSITASLTDIDAAGELLADSIYNFSLASPPEQPMQLGEFPLKLSSLAFEFQAGKLKGLQGSGELQLPGIKSDAGSTELAWIPFTLGYLDNFFTISVGRVSGLTIGADTDLSIEEFHVRFNHEKIEKFTVAAGLKINGIEEENQNALKSIAVQIEYDDAEKTFLAGATGEQRIKIGSFRGIISAINFGWRNGNLDQFGFGAGLYLAELQNEDGQEQLLLFGVQQNDNRFHFEIEAFSADTALRLKSLELSFSAFEFSLEGGKPVPPSNISGTLLFPPKSEDHQELTFGMELLPDGFELKVASDKLKDVAIGSLTLQLHSFRLRKEGDTFESDITGLLQSDSFKDKNGRKVEHLAFEIEITDDGFGLQIAAPEHEQLQVLEVKKVIDVQLGKAGLTKRGGEWDFKFVGDFTNLSEVPFIKKTIPRHFIFKQLDFDTDDFIPDLDLELKWPEGQNKPSGRISGGELEILIPASLSFGGIFKAKHIQISTRKADASSFGVGLTLISPSVHLGPVAGSIDSIGFELITAKNGTGNLGFVDFAPTFSAPKGIGIGVNSPLITGGGYLRMDREAGTFEGVLALSMKSIELTAIGLIATKFPNNRKGFSMLISISVIFRPGIQLSFGFTLVGVGGMIGINRTIAVDNIRERLRSGKLENIMFPRDVIKNAPKIISSLRSIFPVQNKHFVIAPFLRIGWGTPTLISVDLGVFLEIPFKGRIILIGGVGLKLPVPKTPLVDINIDVLGDFNFADRYIRVEGVLRNSKLVGIPLKGGFAFVLGWGNRPQFLFSVGGYHPRYKKPDLFPSIGRLSAVIKKGSSITISCEYYQAVSSNSFQIGAAAELKAKFGPARIHGYFSFDALLQFNPFAFEVGLKYGVYVKVKGKKLAGVEFDFLLKGPKPWTINGTAKIKILFFKLKIRIRLKWGGEQRKAQLKTSADLILERLSTSLGELRNWKAQLPNATQSAELLRDREEEEETLLLLHPAGYFEVRQNIVPLDRNIQTFGKTVVQGSPKFTISSIEVGGREVRNLAGNDDLREYFSRGQYEELSKAKQLSTADFELMNAGLKLHGLADILLSDDIEESPVEYELEGMDTTSRNSQPEMRRPNLSSTRRQQTLLAAKPLPGRNRRSRFGMVADLPLRTLTE